MSKATLDQVHGPDARGHFGPYGGRFVAETLMGPLDELEQAFRGSWADPAFRAQFDRDLAHYVGRPSPLYHAERLSDHLGGAKIYMKRDELNHTGAHKVNNVLGQIILARRMGKTRIIAETGALSRYSSASSILRTLSMILPILPVALAAAYRSPRSMQWVRMVSSIPRPWVT